MTDWAANLGKDRPDHVRFSAGTSSFRFCACSDTTARYIDTTRSGSGPYPRVSFANNPGAWIRWT